jgi:hypothetical protein
MFLKQVGVSAAGAASALTLSSPVAAQSTDKVSQGIPVPAGVVDDRIIKAFVLRVGLATADALIPPASNVDNGDDARYPDKGGSYTKGLPHDAYGRVNLSAYNALKRALASGDFSDYAAIPLGGARTLNGPQGALTFDLERPDNVQFGNPPIPAAPPIAGAVSASEMVEHYWGALLNDVAFTDYPSNPLAIEAANEFTHMPSYLGPRTSTGQVTPNLLFRGVFPGEERGPYISQFFITPTKFGAQPISMMMDSFQPGQAFVLDFNEWKEVQDGNVFGTLQFDNLLRFRRNGRDLAAFTHVDELFQAYFVAYLAMATLGVPPNPGIPYIGSNQNAFGSFGGPDIASTLSDVAGKALDASWYQKWNVHLRPRPEVLGGFIHLVKTGQGNKTDVQPHPVVLNSVGLLRSFQRFNSWLLPQAFPEASPTHPAYPAGHGTVGGACITVLKFFFDGDFVIQHPKVPTPDGLSLVDYISPDSRPLTVNGELAKIGSNVTFGHGTHAGIHWRSDSHRALLLGEAVAIAYLKERTKTYNEPFSITIKKFDGTPVTFTNQGNP